MIKHDGLEYPFIEINLDEIKHGDSNAPKCTHCGGSFNEKTESCRFCGAIFELRKKRPLSIYRIVPRKGLHIIGAKTTVNKELINIVDEAEIADLVQSRITESIAKKLRMITEIKEMEDKSTNTRHYTALLRVLDSEFEF